MMKFTCTRTSVSDIFYATLIAENEEQAREMAMAEAEKRWAGAAGRPRNWSVGILEKESEGPARILDCGRRDA